MKTMTHEEMDRDLDKNRSGSLDDRIKMKLLIVWLQHRDVHLFNHKIGCKPEVCLNAQELIDQFCSEI